MAKISGPAQDLYATSAGLDLLSGVFGYLSSLQQASAASSRAKLLRQESEFDAQRYAEEASSYRAKQKVAFLASGVTLAGSPIDVLDASARIASENIDAIRRRGATEALNQDIAGTDEAIKGRNALVGGLGGAATSIAKAGGFLGFPQMENP